VLVRGNYEVQTLFTAPRIGQHRLQIREGVFQACHSAERAAIDEDVKVVDRISDFSRLRNATVKAVANFDVVGSH
jgi:hypothetical protein